MHAPLPRQLPKLELREAVTSTLIDETAARRLDAFIAATPLDGRRRW